MNRPGFFASLMAEHDHRPAAAADVPARTQPLTREQADRLAHLFRLSSRAGKVHPLAHLVEIHLAKQTP